MSTQLPLPHPGRMGRTLLAAALQTGELIALKLVGAGLAVLVAASCLSYPALLFGLRALQLDDVRILLAREREI
jgi:hypothetical protein